MITEYPYNKLIKYKIGESVIWNGEEWKIGGIDYNGGRIFYYIIETDESFTKRVTNHDYLFPIRYTVGEEGLRKKHNRKIIEIE